MEVRRVTVEITISFRVSELRDGLQLLAYGLEDVGVSSDVEGEGIKGQHLVLGVDEGFDGAHQIDRCVVLLLGSCFGL